jgi:predicted RNA binding protein YcfA (HicA-like mRNA interferase family)
MICKNSSEYAQKNPPTYQRSKKGGAIDHISGSHRIFKHPKVGGHVSLAGKDGDDAKPYEEKNVREAIQKSQGL